MFLLFDDKILGPVILYLEFWDMSDNYGWISIVGGEVYLVCGSAPADNERSVRTIWNDHAGFRQSSGRIITSGISSTIRTTKTF